jgi:putative protease
MDIIKTEIPDAVLHLSTQASTVISASINFWKKFGVSRVVLARELSLEEIRLIRQNIDPETELECFVHGAMCVSYSGRCLLSNYFVGRDANHGACAQPCRWEYNGDGISAEISEIKRPEIKLTALENERGTFIFSSKDMCMIEHIPELVKAGINSFKIEGRVKSAYYTAVTANAYKTELTRYLENPDEYIFDPAAKKELESVSHREYCTGYFFDHPLSNAQITENGGYIKEKAFLATVEAYDKKTGRATLIQRNKAVRGSSAEIISPGKCGEGLVLEEMFDEAMNPIESAPHPFMKFYVRVPFEVKPGDIMRSGE